MPATTRWQVATIVDIATETKRIKSFRLRLHEPRLHVAGQHYVVRLTAPDGYVASRSYSIASPPGDPSQIVLAIERLDDGEVSAYLHDIADIGDELEVRGPIGQWFTWNGATSALLIGGGSGMIPLLAMMRHSRQLVDPPRLHLIVSVHTPGDLPFADELEGPGSEVIYTRVAPPGHHRPPRRLTLDDLPDPVEFHDVFVCGSNNFANHVTALLQSAGASPDHIRVERFGPSG